MYTDALPSLQQNIEDGIFQAIDNALNYVLSYTHCTFITFTHATHIYGSDVIHSVRSGASSTSSHTHTVVKGRGGRKGWRRGKHAYNTSHTHTHAQESLQYDVNSVYGEMISIDPVKAYMLPMDSAHTLYESKCVYKYEYG